MNGRNPTRLHGIWLRRFLLLTLFVAILHFSLMIILGNMFDDFVLHPDNQAGQFIRIEILSLITWILSMPTHLVLDSHIGQQLGPLAYTATFYLNSVLWGLVLGAIGTWLWRRYAGYLT